jgi:MFS family permease
LARRQSTEQISRTVVLLGLTSLFTDISSEMVTTILPLYLIYTLGLTPLEFGVIDGLQQGAASLVQVASGFAADRFHRYKAVATCGYGLSAACRVGLLAAGNSFGLISATIFVDRTGKGIRTAPRDAMISFATPTENLGTAFGVHRALDTAGAMIGPLVAFGLLVLIPNGFHSIFVVSLCFALIGLSIIGLFVHDPKPSASDPTERPALHAVAGLIAQPAFRALLLAGGALALATMSDGFVYLLLQQHLKLATRTLPLLFVATSFVYMLLAVPIGRLADRIGRGRVFLVGYALLLPVYASLLAPTEGVWVGVAAIVLFGTYYAATDGVLSALASSLLPSSLRASGLSLVVTVTGVARLVASIAFGAVWTFASAQLAVIVFAVGLIVALAVAVILLREKTGKPVDA